MDQFHYKAVSGSLLFCSISPYPSIGRAAFISGLFTPKG